MMDNELIEAPLEDGFDDFNDETFGGEQEWLQDEHEQLAGFFEGDAKPLADPFSADQFTMRDIESSVGRLVDDDDGDVIVGQAIPKRRTTDLNDLFGPASPPAFPDAEVLVYGKPDIWGSPAAGAGFPPARPLAPLDPEPQLMVLAGGRGGGAPPPPPKMKTVEELEQEMMAATDKPAAEVPPPPQPQHPQQQPHPLAGGPPGAQTFHQVPPPPVFNAGVPPPIVGSPRFRQMMRPPPHMGGNRPPQPFHRGTPPGHDQSWGPGHGPPDFRQRGPPPHFQRPPDMFGNGPPGPYMDPRWGNYPPPHGPPHTRGPFRGRGPPPYGNFGPPRPHHQFDPHMYHHSGEQQWQQQQWRGPPNGGGPGPAGGQGDGSRGDEYAGLMSQREKDYVIRIQMLQLHSDDPYTDDYYFIQYTRRKQEEAARRRVQEGNEAKHPPELVLPNMARMEHREYQPRQFDGALGKLTASCISHPRTILDLPRAGHGDDDITEKQRDTRRFRRLLLHVEKGYSLLLELDSIVRKIPTLSDQAKVELEQKRAEVQGRLGEAVSAPPEGFLATLAVRKARALLARTVPHCTLDQAVDILSQLLQHFGAVSKKDSADQALRGVEVCGAAVMERCDPAQLLLLVKSLDQPRLVTDCLASSVGSTLVFALLNSGATHFAGPGPHTTAWSLVVRTVAEEVGSGSPIAPSALPFPSLPSAFSCLPPDTLPDSLHPKLRELQPPSSTLNGVAPS